MKNEQKVDVVKTIEDEIVALSNGIKKLRSGRLNDRAIITLINESTSIRRGYTTTRVGKTEVQAVLDAVENLPAYYFKKKKDLEAQ